ncbi:NgoPII family restriction endonuclease [Mammaliicoccus sciuri]|uniref:NgoPII family restriction endonuclease n=1 Tax=Mammaliicoccus sciuri TaxID=1296 RepID=UPI001FB21E2F|nr:NgoPII family restriction endonuclease [Mammaliicoccus sciuri]MCJ0916139.1 NgoPII family restriction endonuclease [Mammaliicoccus sciuri]MCJ0936840.1 NgoPII family restriction endonuclease [Mammaliicoccus sciuri]
MGKTANTNVLIALKNILDRNSSLLTPIFRSNGTVNAAGDSLEYFVKDMFCTGASQYQYEHEKQKVYEKYLTWQGDSKHFPDFIVRDGVGVEPKKVNDNSGSTLSLNSSYPKDYIYPDSQNLPKESLIKESNWQKKEVIYVVGNLNTKNNKLISIWMVYGNTFIPNRDVYHELINEIRESISKTNATLKKSKELARAIGVDPLGNSNLRVRGMYELRHPSNVFGQYIDVNSFPKDSTRIYLVILKKDLDKLENNEIQEELSKYYSTGRLIKKEMNIPDPNNVSDKLSAVIFMGYTN